jgi:anti-anti-sigma factor
MSHAHLNRPVTPVRSETQSSYVFIRDAIDGAELVHVIGEIDLSAAPELEAILDTVADSARALILDFSACQYFDSTTITILIRKMKAFGERFVIVIPDDRPMRRVLRVCNLEDVLSIEPSLASAVTRLELG